MPRPRITVIRNVHDFRCSINVTTDLTDHFGELEARLTTLVPGVEYVHEHGRYGIFVEIAESFRWEDGTLDSVIEVIKEVLEYDDPEITIQ